MLQIVGHYGQGTFYFLWEIGLHDTWILIIKHGWHNRKKQILIKWITNILLNLFVEGIRTQPYPVCTCRNKNIYEKKCKVNRTLRKYWQNNLSGIAPLHCKTALHSGYLCLVFSILTLRSVYFCVVSHPQWGQWVLPGLRVTCPLHSRRHSLLEGSIISRCLRYDRY